jgi:hypothetical protein
MKMRIESDSICEAFTIKGMIPVWLPLIPTPGPFPYIHRGVENMLLPGARRFVRRRRVSPC